MKLFSHYSKPFVPFTPSRQIYVGLEVARPAEAVDPPKDGEAPLSPEQSVGVSAKRINTGCEKIAKRAGKIRAKPGAASKVEGALGACEKKAASAKNKVVGYNGDCSNLRENTLARLRKQNVPSSGEIVEGSDVDTPTGGLAQVEGPGLSSGVEGGSATPEVQSATPEEQKPIAIEQPVPVPIAAEEKIAAVGTPSSVATSSDVPLSKPTESSEVNIENLAAMLEKGINSAKESLSTHLARFESTIADNNAVVRGTLRENFEKNKIAIQDMIKNMEELLTVARGQLQSKDYKNALQNYKSVGVVLRGLFEAGKIPQTGEFMLSGDTQKVISDIRSDAELKMKQVEPVLNSLVAELQKKQ